MHITPVNVHPLVTAAFLFLAVIAILLFLSVSVDSLSTDLVYEAF